MVVLILVPVKDHLLDPLLLRCKLLPSALQKMALGMFFGFASVLVAGVWARVEGRGGGGWVHFRPMPEPWAWTTYTLPPWVSALASQRV